MADIPLRTYVQQLDNLIERKNVDEAIAHSRHILSFYPKHLDTYRMLGKALLEKGRHGDAADVFQRVLSVLPDDFISHVGMAIVREDEANLEAALWHMERAFEATPSNGAIQQELCRLYGRRDGVVPPKARLTRGALGRMYTQGGLYVQAEAELKAALNVDPERIDLQTLLAQVYWYSDQPAAAAQLCGTIVQSLPYSQVGNRILREIFRSRGRDADATLYRQRLEALDPYEAMAAPAGDSATLSTAEQVDPSQVLVTRLEYVAGMEGSGGPDWIASIGARFEEPLSRSAGDSTPDWLNAPAQPTPVDAADVPGTSGVPDWLTDASPAAELAAAQPGEDMPAWLSELSQASATGAPAPVADSDLPDWLQGATGPLADADVPDWMQNMSAAGAQPRETLPTRPIDETMPAWLAAAQNQAAEPEAPAGVPDWMDTLAPASPAAPMVEPQVPGADADLPDWIKTAAPLSAADDELPDWLKAGTGTLTTPVDADETVAPWVADTTPETPAAPKAVELPAEALPDWMDTATPAAPASDLPDWMQAAAPVAPEASAHEAALAADPATPAADTPDWLSALAPADDVPAWMQAAAPATPEDSLPAEPAFLAGVLPEASAESLPPWLAGVTEASPSDDVLPWMQTAVPGAPEAASIEAAADVSDEILRPAGDVPDWLAADTASSPTSEVPAWLQPAAPEVSAEVPAIEPSAIAAEPEVPASELPDWLAAASATSPADEVPAWMQTVPEMPTLSAVEPAAAEAEQAPAADAMPDWLQAMAPAAADDTPPDWMADPAAAEAEATPTAAEDTLAWLNAMAAASPSDEVPAWLQPAPTDGVPTEPADLEATSALASASATPLDEVPAWLQAPTEAAAALETEGLPAASETPSAEATPAGEVPDWLRAVSAASPSEEVPAWLQTGSLDLDSVEAVSGLETPRLDEEAAGALEDQLPGGAASGDEAVATPAADMPDWLRALTADTEDNRTAHFAALADTEFGEVEPGDLDEDEPEEPLQPLPEGIPDWLQAMADAAPPPDSEPKQPEAEAEAPASPSVVELPDFLQLASPEAIARAETPYELSETAAEAADVVADAEAELAPGDMPDWLKALAPQASAASTPAPAFDSDIMAAAAAGLNLDEAPDWMKTATPAEAALPLGDLPLGDVPAWLQSAEPEAPALGAMDLNLDDAPDWLQEAAAVTPTIPGTGELTPPAELAETPAWLSEATGEQPADLPPWAQPEAPGASDTIIGFLAGKDTPEWLKALRQTAAPEEAPAGAASAAAPPEPEMEAELPALEASMPDAVAEPPGAATVTVMEAAPAASEPAVPMEPSLDDMSPDETMRWLESLAARQGASADELFMSPSEPAAETPAAEPAMTTAPLGEPSAPEAPGGLPEWLREVEANFEVDALADTAPHGKVAEPTPAAELPDWLTAAAPAEAELENPAEPVLDQGSIERPSWLSEMEALGSEDVLTPAVTEAEPAFEAPSSERPAWLAEMEALADAEAGTAPPAASEDDALRWLEEQAALAEAKAVPVQGLEATEGLDDVGVAAEAGLPDIESMNADEAMAWLEKLAAQQGASAEELLTAPEDRPDEAPAWIVAAQQAEPQTEADRPAPEPGLVPEWLAELEAAEDEDVPLEPAVLPDWLKPPSEAVVEPETMPATALGEPEPAAAQAAGPDFANMDADAAMAWLEGLAAQQGANPDELMTAPEERTAEAPTWVQDEQLAAAQASVIATPTPEPVETSTLPVLEAAPPPEPVLPEPPVAEQPPAPVEPGAPDVDRLARLSDRLAANRRAKEAEIESRFAQQRAEQEEARRLVWESMQAKKAAVEAAIEAMAPEEAAPAEPPAPVAPEPARPAANRGRTGPLTPPPARPTPRPQPSLPDESAWVPAVPPRQVRVPSRYAGQAPETVLAEAQAHLEQQDAVAAAAALEHLVGEGQLVDTVIVELEQAGAAAPAPLLRVLGDAYARSNRLQQALDTYRQALRRL